MTAPITPAVRAELAPAGKLRVGLNYGNFLLVLKDAAGGEPQGIAPDLARELGRRVGVPVEFVRFDQAGKMADAVTTGVWDVAFLAAEPARADVIAFTAAYLEIEATYLVPAGSAIRPIADVEIGCRTVTACILNNIAIRTGKTIHWDPMREEITNDRTLNRWLDRTYRNEWCI